MKKVFTFLCLFVLFQIQTSADNSKNPALSSIFKQHFIGPLDAQQQTRAFFEGCLYGGYSNLKGLFKVKDQDSIKVYCIKSFLTLFIANSSAAFFTTHICLQITNGKPACTATRVMGYATGALMSTALLTIVQS